MSNWRARRNADLFYADPKSALRQARAVAGDRDIRIAGGADAIQQYDVGPLGRRTNLATAPATHHTPRTRSRFRSSPDQVQPWLRQRGLHLRLRPSRKQLQP
ncbi:MAG TPA: hypothetical protein VF483_07445 [Gemmatimonadaceae bacterium]